MDVTPLITRPCTITRGARVDRDDFDLDVDDPEAPEPETVEAVCELQQRQRSEDRDGGEVSSTDWTGYFLPDVELGTADVVTVEGVAYEVVGDPWKARDPLLDRDSHVEASLRRTAGAADS